MGSTYSCCWIGNTGVSPKILSERKDAEKAKRAESDRGHMWDAAMLLPPEIREEYERERASAPPLFRQGLSITRPSSAVAYRRDAPWLPFYEEQLCDGNIADSQSAERISRRFQAPVLVMALFDSDIFFLSYCSADSGVRYDYAKPNSSEIEEYDTDLYRTEYPEFLASLFPSADPDALHRAWEEEEVFADDLLGKLCGLLGLPLLSGNGTPPEGFELL